MTLSTGNLVLLLTLGPMAGVVLIGCYLWYAAALARVFAKRNVEPWRGWVPVLNEAEILGLGGIAPWMVVLYFIPVIDLYGLYLKIVATHRLNRTFRHGGGMTVLAILLPPVWASILAWGRQQPEEPDREIVAVPTGAAASGPLADLPPTGNVAPPPGIIPAASVPAPTDVPSKEPEQWKEPEQSKAPEQWARREQPVYPPWSGHVAPTVESPDATSDPVQAPARLPVQAPARLPVPTPVPLPPPMPLPAPAVDPDAMGPRPSIGAWIDTPPGAPIDTPPGAPIDTPPGARIDTPPGARIDTPPGARIDTPPGAPLDAPLESSWVAPADRSIDTGTVVIARGSLAEHDDDGDETIVVNRRRPLWRLHTDEGEAYDLDSPEVVVGRRPSGSERGVQYLAVADGTKTLSKQHARLSRDGDTWTITDLGSTNGVLLVDEHEQEHPLEPGVSVEVTGRILLGKVGIRIDRSDV